jgi:hypothetical protein
VSDGTGSDCAEVVGIARTPDEDATSELEKRLVDRVVISGIEVYHCDISLAQHPLQVYGAAKTAQRWLALAHARYVSTSKALVRAHELVRPTPSPLDLAVQFVPEQKASAAGLRPAVDRAEGVRVLN